jgi:hypothetical protein
VPQVRKMAKLPPDMRQWFERACVERAFGDIEGLTEELNELMKRAGIAVSIGKSAVGAESLRLKRAQESIAATTRAMQLVAQTAQDPADLRGETLNAMVAEGMFEAMLDLREAEAEPDPAKRIGLMNKAALATARLSTASVRQRRYRAEVEKATKAAADAVGRLASAGGLSHDQVSAIRAQILGIPKTHSAAVLGVAEPAAGDA